MSNKLSQKALDFSMISSEGTIPSPRAQMFRDYMTQPYPDYSKLMVTGVDSDTKDALEEAYKNPPSVTGTERDALLELIMDPVSTDTRIRAMLNPINTIGRMNIGRLYEIYLNQLVKEVREQINKGPLKDMVGIYGMIVNEKNYNIFYAVGPTFRAKNRVKAYRGYLESIMATAEEALAELFKQGE